MDVALVNLLKHLISATVTMRKELADSAKFDLKWSTSIYRSARKVAKREPDLVAIL